MVLFKKKIKKEIPPLSIPTADDYEEEESNDFEEEEEPEEIYADEQPEEIEEPQPQQKPQPPKETMAERLERINQGIADAISKSKQQPKILRRPQQIQPTQPKHEEERNEPELTEEYVRKLFINHEQRIAHLESRLFRAGI